jgi:hypothetical protein
MLPADACPFRRPFRPDFGECPAYQPRAFVALDLRDRPLPPVLTCQHLEVRPVGTQPHRYYARCGIGEAAARERWLRQLHEQHVQTLRALGAEIADRTQPFLVELWEAKGLQLQAQRSGGHASSATRRLRQVAARLRQTAAVFIEQHRAELDGAGLPVPACLELTDALLDRFVTHPSADIPTEIPADMLARFPEAIRVFFQPHRPGPESRSAAPATSLHP